MARDCRHIRDLLGPYADSELDQAGVAKVEAHVAGCADCRRELAEIRHLHKLVQARVPPDIGDSYAERVRIQVGRRLREQLEPAEARRRQARVPWLGLASAAAGLAVIVIVAVGGFDVLLRRQHPQAGLEARARAATPEAAPVVGVLPSAARSEPAKAKAASPLPFAGGAARSEPVAASSKAGAVPAPRLDDEVATAVASEQEVPVAEIGGTGPAAGRAGLKATQDRDRARAAAPAQPEAEPSVELSQAAKKQEARPPVAGFVDVLKALADTLAQLVQWPSLAEKIADSGTAQVRVLVNADGSVLGASIARPSGSARVDSLAVRMARAARYQPLVEDGVRRPTSLVVPFSYSAPADEPSSEPRPAPPPAPPSQPSSDDPSGPPAEDR